MAPPTRKKVFFFYFFSNSKHTIKMFGFHFMPVSPTKCYAPGPWICTHRGGPSDPSASPFSALCARPPLWLADRPAREFRRGGLQNAVGSSTNWRRSSSSSDTPTVELSRARGPAHLVNASPADWFPRITSSSCSQEVSHTLAPPPHTTY